MKALCVNTSGTKTLIEGQMYNVRYCTIDSINVFIPFYNDWFTYSRNRFVLLTTRYYYEIA